MLWSWPPIPDHRASIRGMVHSWAGLSVSALQTRGLRAHGRHSAAAAPAVDYITDAKTLQGWLGVPQVVVVAIIVLRGADIK